MYYGKILVQQGHFASEYVNYETLAFLCFHLPKTLSLFRASLLELNRTSLKLLYILFR